jgi:hypothetical protein
MVDHIQMPKGVAPLFPTAKIKKVRRRKDRQQDAGFKENLEKEKKNAEDEEEDSHEPDQTRKQAAVSGSPVRAGSEKEASSSKNKRSADDRSSEKRIDVHA